MRTASITEKDITPRITCTAFYVLEVNVVDGTHGVVDISHRICHAKAGAFERLKRVDVFNQVFLEYGAATWPGGIDLAPDAMCDEIKQKGQWVLK